MHPARTLERFFQGTVSPWPYAIVRVATAGIFLVRHSDWLRPWIWLEHYRWVRGLEFTWSIAASPPLVSPLVPGLVLDETATRWLVYVRTALAVSLLVGARPRACAGLLALVSYVLFAADRYRYFHHLHLLYVSVAWLALAPLGDRLNIERAVRRAWSALRGTSSAELTAPDWSPVWPLQLLRAFVMSVYFAAGVSKLHGEWLSGHTLEHMHRVGVISGAPFATLQNWLGYAGIARLTCLSELGLPLLLAARPTRYAAIALAIAFHAFLSASMRVSTFGLQMVVLLTVFACASRATGANST